ncbi:Smr/MutS family protein [Ancylobacter sp. 6x-1]|uniref:Smr/MutS family protein n=1 Tax=Ancylobacter crimeensis TaxID=2579147 RepID=A0ABT0DBZ8_9HYPH|nr:Smr/MutS family protein [Ancylobacter crimeensis]MCK0197486.1 Smr/MutS family protein [Ancylobacter crimeensis]
MSGWQNGRRRSRTLNPDERALWKYVTRDIERLHAPPPPAAPDAPKPVETASPPAEMPASTAGKAAPAVRPEPAPAPSAPPLAPMEPKLRRRLSRGVHEVEARIDLHGLTQAAAHHRLHSFLIGAQHAGYGVVLVITGKGSGEAGFSFDGGRGVLRRVVPQWLAEPALRSVVIGFETAARGHGGEGALYVRIRRARGYQP